MHSATREIGSWTLSEERVFIENLLCQRLNFMLVFYSLVITGACATDSCRNFRAAFLVGAIICSLLSLSIARTQVKLELILLWIREQREHPATLTDQRVRSAVPKGIKWLVGKSGRKIVGYWIPIACAMSMWAALILACTGYLAP
jgi:hypothetical protein